MLIENRKIGDSEPVLVIAEAGINHDGDFNRAKQLIQAAAEADADVIKFQTHLADEEMLNLAATGGHIQGESLYQLMRRVELSVEEHRCLQAYARDCGLIFLSTPFSRAAVDLLDSIAVPAFKIGSAELSNLPFLRYVASRGKPVIFSTGMSEWKEIEEAIELFSQMGIPFAVMHCTSEYPTPPEHLRLSVISALRRVHPLVGLSDHSASIDAAVIAVDLGAVIIEKHFTVSRQWPGPDQLSSLEPFEFKKMVSAIRAAESLRFSSRSILPNEKTVRTLFSESIVSLRDINASEVLTEENLGLKRPGGGLSPRLWSKILGQQARKFIPKNTMIAWEDTKQIKENK